MYLNIIKEVIKYINEIPSNAKTCIIILLCGIIFINYIKYQNDTLLKDYNVFVELKELNAETYTFETAADINEHVLNIARKDSACYNVLLLSYHNTQKSLQGYRYLYLNCLTEKPKGLESEPLREYWSDLEYIYYEDELSKIHNREYLLIKNIDDIKFTMPKIYKKLKISGANAAGFYTIEGLSYPIGMVVILYSHPLYSKIDIDNIYPDILKLAVLLDYANYKK